MSSVINTNIAAIRTHNVYSRNDTQMNAALTRVATGMKINSAKDGASTWAISEKMRERIRANDQANQNIQNDTALLRTAQGGIDNTISILKTLKERALNAANDSNLNSDRTKIAAEVQELVAQIDDNANKVKFNGRTLLNGAADDTVAQLVQSAASSDSSSSTVNTSALTTTATAASDDTTIANGTKTGTYTSDVFYLGANQNALSGGSGDFKTTSNGTALSNAATNTKLVNLYNSSDTNMSEKAFQVDDVITLNYKINGEEKSATYKVGANDTFTNLASGLTSDSGGNLNVQFVTAANTVISDGSNNVLKYTDENGTTVAANTLKPGNTTGGLYVTGKKDANITELSLSISREVESSGVSYTPTATQSALQATRLTDSGNPVKSFVAADAATTTTSSSGALTFYIGGETGFGIDVTIGGMTTDVLFKGTYSATNGGSTYTLDKNGFSSLFLKKDDALKAIDVIDNALSTALTEQTKLGAVENRLGYTADNLTTMNENLAAADSAMRDADMAKEMTTYMKYSVLAQASQYMLAQASQNAFSVLNLLQA